MGVKEVMIATGAGERGTIGRKIWRGCQAGPSPSRLVELQKADSWQEPDGWSDRQVGWMEGQLGEV